MATLTIPDTLYEQLQAAAARQQRPVEELLRKAIAMIAHAEWHINHGPVDA